MAIARAVAGFGGGGLVTMAAVVIHDLFPLRQRGQYQSYVNMAQTVGTTIGAPLGGFISDSLGWRYCFYINIPPCVAILVIYTYKLKNYNLDENNPPWKNFRHNIRKIDFIGALTLLIANISFVTATSLGGNTHSWSDPLIVILLIGSVFFFLTFGFYEFNWAKHPLLSAELMKNRNVAAGVMGYNASSAGMWVLPRTAMVATGCWSAGRYLRYKGRYKRYLNAIMVIHVIAIASYNTWKPDIPLIIPILTMNFEGYCMGTVIVATMVALVADIAQQETATATSMLFLCRSTGWLSGSTFSAAILQSNFKKSLTENIQGPEADKLKEPPATDN
ncbi:hypothetical protein EC973_006849 [Apophysomyces ossiformis]|uniref:Major facilitator superfamily (MFS) profile domain-containing protein n=1 Tax=Apophysomyces ossiformis TaxID=679940 RepID=A0A8H7BUQ1_9FUNG|nr:hypothetical protein EC973_006849 [Apophysomyces ossiformis]